MMNNFQIPPQILNMIKGGGNPQQIAMSMLSNKAKGNPMLENLLNMVNNGNEEGITTICKNILKSKGYDPDELMKNIQNQLK